MNGFIVVNLRSGMLLFSRDYTKDQNFGFSEPFEGNNDGPGPIQSNDPMNLASYFFANIKMVDMMAEEVAKRNTEMSPEAREATQQQLEMGFTGLETDGNSFVISRSHEFQLLFVVFYNSDRFEKSWAEGLVHKIMDIFTYKYERKLKSNRATSFDSFDQALTVIYQDTIKDML